MNSSVSSSFDSSTLTLSQSEQEKLIGKLDIFKVQGTDKRGRQVLRIIGKLFPAKLVSEEALKNYLETNIFSGFGDRRFCVVYVHTGVQKSENFPGISALRSVYEFIPINIRNRIEEIYFLHPDLQSRLFFATFGRLLFTGGLYGKLKYVRRLEFLWDHVRRNEMELPEYVYDHDEELDYRPMVTYYGLESDHPRVPTMDASYAMRCIA